MASPLYALLVISLAAVVFLPCQISAQDAHEVFSLPAVAGTEEHDHSDHDTHGDHDHAAHPERGGVAAVSAGEADAELAEDWETFPIEYRWLAAIVTGVILSVNSLVGVFVLQCLGKGAVGKGLQYALVVLSIAVMVSDSLIHLYPHALEGASHDAVTKLGITAFAGCLAVVLFSQLLQSIHGGHHHDHDHHHHPNPQPPSRRIPAERTSATVADDAEKTPSREGEKIEEGRAGENGDDSAEAKAGEVAVAESGVKKAKVRFDWRSVESYGWAALAGDVVCNFVDGITVGIAWYVGWFVGVVTSIAILAHEIPQELSDYAVLRLSGLSNCLVITVNIAASVTSLVGIVVGLGFSTMLASVVQDFERYCLAFTCGAWLSIGLLVLGPIALKLHTEMTGKGAEGQPAVMGQWVAILVAVVMMAVALGIMVGIGVLEGMTHEHEHSGAAHEEGHEGHNH